MSSCGGFTPLCHVAMDGLPEFFPGISDFMSVSDPDTHNSRIVGISQVAISPTSGNSTLSSGDANLRCVFGVSRQTRPTPTVQKHRLQVKNYR